MTKLFQKYQVAILAALESSEAIMEIYNDEFEKIIKEDGSPVTKADLSSSKIIAKHLKTTDIPITGEEIEKEPFEIRSQWEENWCVDPLDGTKEFIKKNGEFVINIAHITKGKPAFGLIASPVNRQIILGNKASGAFQTSYEDALDPSKWKKLEQLPKVNSPIHIIASRSHYSGNLLKLAQYIEQNYGAFISTGMGSALKFFDLVKGTADVYPRFAPTMEWDIAAGHAIYEAIGGEVIDVKTGKSLVYNKKELKNPYFVASKASMQLSMEFFQ
ncbi:3'(2'),5'-bisphosphate nucleotidase CysQ family protein [Brumimicrobium aurantiacum]|uniref:3'(2'),5'-bisphosphate nucleotidase CysQ n=1 Tax=Brumimicrobium aurantiacum TaxID=1737063 RepID=A0A3E1EX14_9FLAO|nr:inositol monophosphatase family protein [Brumimicrobium aurantiacum]RFC54100.1 3'(2'),5'-bisphosphate nucleotidase CysQ [Brumimicrobium aurantiacum]